MDAQQNLKLQRRMYYEMSILPRRNAAGYIPNGGQPVQWIPNGERPSALSFSIAEQGVPLINQFKPLKANGYKAEAHYCSNCKVIIAPTKN